MAWSMASSRAVTQVTYLGVEIRESDQAIEAPVDLDSKHIMNIITLVTCVPSLTL